MWFLAIGRWAYAGKLGALVRMRGAWGSCFLAGMMIGRGLGTAAWGKAAEFEKAGAVGEKPQGCADSALATGGIGGFAR